jgi:hypothetical protein
MGLEIRPHHQRSGLTSKPYQQKDISQGTTYLIGMERPARQAPTNVLYFRFHLPFGGDRRFLWRLHQRISRGV